MQQRIGAVVLLSVLVTVTTVLVAARAQATSEPARVSAMTVHEWGTFTSVAGEDGQAIRWQPFGRPSELPCFVTLLNPTGLKVSPEGYLPSLKATVRMETPVLYFYSASDETARVKVGFPQGLITEWYPQAVVPPITPWIDIFTTTGSIEWPEVKIRPAAAPELPDERDGSHYYAARETDGAIVQIGNQSEKFLFYRGLASFPVPLSVQSRGDGSFEIRNHGHFDLRHTGPQEIGGLILFENYGGRIAFRVLGGVRESARVFRPTMGDLPSLKKDMHALLVENGLYPREAAAMLETWRDSWFTEGTRLFYVLPQAAMESILPLDIDPKPAQVSRVFVGRIEVITPTTENAVIAAIRGNDDRLLAGHSRFLEPIVQRILATRPADLDQTSAQLALRMMTAWHASSERTCR
jgi:hypothetical protein